MSKQPPSEDQPDSDGSSSNGPPSNGLSANGPSDISSSNDGPSNDGPSDNREDSTEILATDPDPVQLGDTAVEMTTETRAAAPPESGTAEVDAERALLDDIVEKPESAGAPKPRRAKSSLPWFGILNFLLILALAGTAAYFWRQQQNLDAAYQANLTSQQSTMAELQLQLQAVEQSSSRRLQSSLSPLTNSIDSLNSEVDELGLDQKSLRESGEKLYQLFGRDRNAWQLAEVEYLMRVAQHKLILQDDFAGAAITLQAASDRIGLTGDPGLLPVRVMISEEIADLKTRRRADLVGMSLMLAQLGRQVRSLQPGFALRVEQSSELPEDEGSADENPVLAPQTPQDWLGRFSDFLDSLISVHKETTEPTQIEANIIDVAEAMEDNLKLARWSVLERDANQYQLLIDRSLRLFSEFYDLDDAANHDFMTQLQELQKMVIKPEKPDITGSLRELQRILSQRAVAPQAETLQAETPQPETLQAETPQPETLQAETPQPETPQSETPQLEAPQPAVEPAPESGNG
jgi:uroporphyrin-3 C-methyltransferase